MTVQIFYSLSERHTHLEFSRSDLTCSEAVPLRFKEAMFLVSKHAACLPRLHRQQVNQGDTASLVVSLFPASYDYVPSVLACMSLSWQMQSNPSFSYAWQVPSMAMMAIRVTDRHEVIPFDSNILEKLLLESISGFVEGRLPGELGDTNEALDTGRGAETQQLCLRLTGVLAGGAVRDVRHHACMHAAHVCLSTCFVVVVSSHKCESCRVRSEGELPASVWASGGKLFLPQAAASAYPGRCSAKRSPLTRS